MRDWSKFENDEIMGVWKAYLATEFPGRGDPLSIRPSEDYKEMRLTPMEIIKLVDILMDRLDIKIKVKLEREEK